MHQRLSTTRLLGKEPLPDQGREYVEILESNASGLLSLVDDILDLSKIEADKLTPGEGSRFFFDIPLPHSGSRVAESRAPTLTSDPHQPGRYHLLLAEDNLANRLIAERLLESLGYQVTAVKNGVEALAALAETEFDLILMDCQMPELDGYEATRRLRHQESSRQATGRRVPVIALTANALKGDRQICLDAGMDEYISKPFREDEIAAILCRFLAGP